MITTVVIVFVVTLLLGFDLGYAMILAALVGMLWGGTMDPVVASMSLVTNVDAASLLTIPLFVLAGEVMNRGGVTARLVEWSDAMVGHFRGSLSQVALMTNLIIAGVSGSAVADAAATGGLMIPAMKKQGYRTGYPSAVIVAGAMLGPILPPSIPMIIYAVMANLSIIKLFMAGVVPAFLLYFGYVAICAVIARREGYAASPKASLGQRLRVTRYSIWALMMPVLIIVGVRSGLFTDTEAAGVIGLYALVISLLVYRAVKVGGLPPIFFDAAKTSAAILFLMAAAGPFTWLLAEMRVAQAIANSLLGLSDDPLVVLLIVNLMLLAVGTILEPLPALVLFVPTLLPIQAALGIDPIHFATVVVLNLMIGMLTPPVGILIFVTASIGREPVWEVTKRSLPFLAWSVAVLFLIIFFPALATWLPSVL